MIKHEPRLRRTHRFFFFYPFHNSIQCVENQLSWIVYESCLDTPCIGGVDGRSPHGDELLLSHWMHLGSADGPTAILKI